MRICLSAPPNLDVTTLAQKLADEQGLTFCADPSRACCEELGFQTLYEIPLAAQQELRRSLIEAHHDMLRTDSDLICDYSLFGMLADWMRWHWADTTSEVWEEVWVEARAIAALYDKIYHVTEAPARTYDGYVWLDQRNADQIARLLPGLYRELGVEDRLEQIAG